MMGDIPTMTLFVSDAGRGWEKLVIPVGEYNPNSGWNSGDYPFIHGGKCYVVSSCGVLHSVKNGVWTEAERVPYGYPAGYKIDGKIFSTINGTFFAVSIVGTFHKEIIHGFPHEGDAREWIEDNLAETVQKMITGDKECSCDNENGEARESCDRCVIEGCSWTRDVSYEPNHPVRLCVFDDELTISIVKESILEFSR